MNKFSRFLFTILFIIIGALFVFISCLNPDISSEAAPWMGILGFLCLLAGFILEILNREDD